MGREGAGAKAAVTKRRRALVTGGAGFIGSHLAEALLKDGVDVVVVDSLDSYYGRGYKESNLAEVRQTAEKYGAPFEFVEGDINEECVLRMLHGDFDTIFHLAAQPGVRPSIENPVAYVDANVVGTTRLLQWAHQKSVAHFVFASSSSVYGEGCKAPCKEDQDSNYPVSPYAATKRAAELMCITLSQLYGLRVAMLRLFSVYGRRQRPDLAIHKFAAMVMKDQVIPLFGDGSTARDYTHVSDVVKGFLGAEAWLRRQSVGTHEIFNLGSNRSYSLAQVVDVVGNAVGRPARVRHEPRQPGDVERTLADITKSHLQLGYWPGVDLETGVKDLVDWLRQQQACALGCS